ncbi:MAG: alpha/beta hydrolase [Alphaproteobacteria bacterium]|nr:alpha/beta hydrolase [Alphaproteobacteria bacterium]
MSAAPLFRGYDRAALDREYDNRNKIPGFDLAAYVAGCGRRSRAVRERVSCVLDLAYGPGPAERLDIFRGRGQGPRPVMVFFHGGYWRAGRKADFSYVAGGLVGAGITTVIVGYPLLPSVTMDDLVACCRRALAWVWREIASHGGDPGRLHVSGHSAGGHLTAMMLTTDWGVIQGSLPADAIKGAVAFSGLYDLEPLRHCFINQTLALDEAAARRNSPALLAPRFRGPLVLAVGAEEGPEFLRQNAALAAAWSGFGPAIRIRELAGEDHFSIRRRLDDSGDSTSRLLRATVE